MSPRSQEEAYNWAFVWNFEHSRQPIQAMALPKQEIITFKVDHELGQMLASLPNRSAFIRQAVLAALHNACPLCMGTGQISVPQKRHWENLVAHYHLERCGICHAIHEPEDTACSPGEAKG